MRAARPGAIAPEAARARRAERAGRGSARRDWWRRPSARPHREPAALPCGLRARRRSRRAGAERDGTARSPSRLPQAQRVRPTRTTASGARPRCAVRAEAPPRRARRRAGRRARRRLRPRSRMRACCGSYAGRAQSVTGAGGTSRRDRSSRSRMGAAPRSERARSPNPGSRARRGRCSSRFPARAPHPDRVHAEAPGCSGRSALGDRRSSVQGCRRRSAVADRSPWSKSMPRCRGQGGDPARRA
jgi:hypothetical protein